MSKISYLLTGVGAGLLLGSLFAPRTGAESRKLFVRKARRARKQVKSAVNDGSRYLAKRGSEARDQAGDLIDRGKVIYRSAGKMLQTAF